VAIKLRLKGALTSMNDSDGKETYILKKWKIRTTRDDFSSPSATRRKREKEELIFLPRGARGLEDKLKGTKKRSARRGSASHYRPAERKRHTREEEERKKITARRPSICFLLQRGELGVRPAILAASCRAARKKMKEDEHRRIHASPLQRKHATANTCLS